jgi:hypothetical protein
MAQHGGRALALLLNAEIAGVLASMRQNSKWSLVPMRYTAVRMMAFQPGCVKMRPACAHVHVPSTRSNVSKQEDDLGDEPLLEDFRLLRRRIFKWTGARLWQLRSSVLRSTLHALSTVSHWPASALSESGLQIGAPWSRWSTCRPFWK